MVVDVTIVEVDGVVLVVAAGVVVEVVVGVDVDVVVAAEAAWVEGTVVAAAAGSSSPDVQPVSAARVPTVAARRTRYLLAVAVVWPTCRVLHPVAASSVRRDQRRGTRLPDPRCAFCS